MKILSWEEFDYKAFEEIPMQKKKPGNPGTRSKMRYKDIITAFDIETTRLADIEQSIMYIWQWAFDDVCYIGRTWEEFLTFCQNLSDHMKDNEHLYCGVHNLSYEFTFLSGIYDFQPDDVFCMEERKILSCTLYGCIDMRCTYLHSNMNLKTYTEQMGAEHSKLSGKEFDYDKLRYPWTELTESELNYCVYDVIGLVEAIKIDMSHEDDNLYTFPPTSTGYIRRLFKKAMKMVSRVWVFRQTPTLHVYEMLREAFRGGNTHCNRWYAGSIVRDVHQVDRSSSYPDEIVNRPFPCDRFQEVGAVSNRRFEELYRVMHRAMLMRVTMVNVRLKSRLTGCPYLPRDKCRGIENGVYDNGRVLEASKLSITITDIDYGIIESQYEWESISFDDVCYTRYGKLPPPVISLVNNLYRQKTALKGIHSDDGNAELNYFRAKQLLNSIFGMVCTQIKDKLLYDHGRYVYKGTPLADLIEKDARNRQLPCYQTGVWTTCWARLDLQKGIDLVENTPGASFIYTDTDSVKYTGDVDWSEYNAECIKRSKRNGSYAVDAKGVTHYTGVFEDEGTAKFFRSWGAKKYAYVDENDKLHLTVAGVIKKDGAEELARHGGLEAFTLNFRFVDAGGVEAVYNDDPDIKEITIDGHVLSITKNVVLRPSTYTLGITDEYEELLALCKLDFDIF